MNRPNLSGDAAVSQVDERILAEKTACWCSAVYCGRAHRLRIPFGQIRADRAAHESFSHFPQKQPRPVQVVVADHCSR